MTTSQYFQRDLLGLALIISSVFIGLNIILDILSVLAFIDHESFIAQQFFNESLYLLVFFIPPYFIAKKINRSEVVSAVEDYLLQKNKKERA